MTNKISEIFILVHGIGIYISIIFLFISDYILNYKTDEYSNIAFGLITLVITSGISQMFEAIIHHQNYKEYKNMKNNSNKNESEIIEIIDGYKIKIDYCISFSKLLGIFTTIIVTLFYIFNIPTYFISTIIQYERMTTIPGSQILLNYLPREIFYNPYVTFPFTSLVLFSGLLIMLFHLNKIINE
ncbi:hypothetical protein [Macrococcoides canis]|uniref:hypothetical protein n=1 Tax=Macrococcoides canis TaxID=1855823 RepID=UPI0010FC16AF|nr:hypothetical protein [Macrococcus canis]QCT75809.1 hypothetical protein EST43_11465 [Macrococcus canis]